MVTTLTPATAPTDHRPAAQSAALGSPQILRPNAPESYRKLRLDARSTLWELSSLPRIRTCGNQPLGQYVGIKASANSAGISGVETCGSVWACPVCSAKIRAARADQLGNALQHHLGNGGTAYFLTLTMRHKGDAIDKTTGQYLGLADLWDDLADAWDAAKSGRVFKDGNPELPEGTGARALRYSWLTNQGITRLPGADALGFLGYSRYVEVTHGENGWHVHVHAVLFFQGLPDPAEVKLLATGMFDRWRNRLQLRGRMLPIMNRGGLDLRRVYSPDGINQYVVGNTGDTQDLESIARYAGNEVTRADIKTTKNDNRTPWQILGDYCQTKNPQDLAIWREWERASQGRRLAVWAHANNNPLWQEILDARGTDLTDEEIANLDLQGDTLGYLDKAGWYVVRHNNDLLDELLTLAQSAYNTRANSRSMLTRSRACDTSAMQTLLALYGVVLYPPNHLQILEKKCPKLLAHA